MSGSDSVLEYCGVRKCYGLQMALRDFTLALPRGCVIALLGPNGAGKSTAVKLAMGLLRCDQGSVRVLGREVLEHRSWAKQHIGYVPELHFIYRWMRVREVLKFCASFYLAWNGELCDSLLDQFKLDLNKKVRHLSKGMTVKLALITALAHEPEVLIFDEATSGLDPLVREELLDGVLQTMCDGRRTILFASHTLQDVQRVADRVAILVDGELLVNRPIDELLQSTRTVRAVLTDGCRPQQAPKGTIFDRIDGREWSVTMTDYCADRLDEMRAHNPVDHIEEVSLNLEEIFKAYVRGRRVVA